MTVRRVAGLVAFNLALFLALAEALSLMAYGYETGALYYIDAARRSVPEEPNRVDDHRIHPYFGFTWDPGLSVPPRRNNHGFVSPVDYPYEPGTGSLIVGIFGGSLASNLAQFEDQHHLIRDRVAAALGRPDDQVVVLNFAQAGYKQPQQVLVATYLRTVGQRFDLAINLDGFNEVALAGHNTILGLQLAMPSASHLASLRQIIGNAGSSDGIVHMARARQSWRRFAAAYNRAWGRQGWETITAAGFLTDWIRCKVHLRSYQTAMDELSQSLGQDGGSSWLYLEPAEIDTSPGAPTPFDQSMAGAVEIWRRAARLFDRQQRAAGDAYLEVIQPNQYHDTGRVFSEEERRIALNEDSPFRRYAQRAYPRLEAALEDLRREGVSAWSATRLFDDVGEPVYRDDCCHLNDLGHRLLAEKLGDLAAEELLRNSAGTPPPVAPPSAAPSRD